MRFLDIVIALLLLAVGYCYLLYPYLIRLLAKFFPKLSKKDESYRPSVSIILAVYNEELVVKRCLESLLSLDYPKELLEIIIGSDGSSDSTSEVVNSYSAQFPFIKSISFPERRGKMPVLNDLVKKASGEILFFADADITLTQNTLRVQLRHFADPSIGIVGGMYHIYSEKEKSLYSSEREYASMEQQIKIHEGIFNSSMGVFGGNYSIRRQLWRPLPDPLVHDDLYVAVSVIDQGKRVIYEKESVSTDLYERSLKDEFRRKSRSASRGYHTLSFFPKLMGFAGGKNAFMLWSHKLLRWLSPFIMLAIVLLAISGSIIFGDLQYQVILYSFAALLIIAAIGWILDTQNIRIPVIRQCTWLLIMNAAYIDGTFKFLMKTDEKMWTQATRHANAGAALAMKEAVHTK
jgi:cellulose synthase/poly-beta-1,6-N-acetylglucosamine synthase-like glycosyltransferase